MVVDAYAIRMGMIAKAEMIATYPGHVAMHRHAADMNASAEAAHMRTATEAADVRASTKSTHMPATTETSAVTATTETSAVTATTSAPASRIGRADGQHGGKRGRGQDHQ
ncbi:hypothetical protein [Bradyrhizobium sp. AZCC 2230]|uniref:hypothetical protein n=1 Tax=Bradyrhizobium sp. AZCC 2230 TaxID=3117021 RepID=UPI003FA535E7